MGRPACVAALWALLICAAALRLDALTNTEALVTAFQTAQQEVLSSWTYNPDFVCAAAGVHGLQQKRAAGGAIAGLITRTASTDPRLPEIAAGLPIFDGLQVYVSEKYRFIYIRQPKASSSSIIATIADVFCTDRVCSAYEFTRMHPGSIDDAKWKDYFVFTAVRNPIARMVSTYNMFQRYLRRKIPGSEEPGEPCSLPFAEFAANVVSLRSICDTQQCCSYLASESRFVDDLPNAHISQQAHAIFTPAGESVVDFIARTESMLGDWSQIVPLIAQRSGQAMQAKPMKFINGIAGRGGALRGALNTCLDREVSQGLLNETTMLQLARQFALDIRMLSFALAPVQTIEDRLELAARIAGF